MLDLEYAENKSKRQKSNVWIEKYRPQNVKSVILPSRYQKLFNKFIEEQEIQNLLNIPNIRPCLQ